MSKKSRREIERERKQKVAVANRLLGWATLLAFLLPRITAVLPFTLSDSWQSTLNALFMFGIFLHGIAGIYLYGVPIFKWHPRVGQIYLGFLIFALILLNRAFVFVPIMRQITEFALWVPISIHALLGLRYLLHRWTRPATYSAIPFYLGGAVVRDVTRGKG